MEENYEQEQYMPEKKYSRRALLKSGIFQKELVTALLMADRQYTLEEAEEIINDYKNRRVI